MVPMDITILWIVIAVIVALLIIVGIIVAVGNNRKKSKTVSFEKKVEDEPKQLTQQEKSGNYQAKGGFNFAPANAPEKQPEPVRREPTPEKPVEQGSTRFEASAGDSPKVDKPVVDKPRVEEPPTDEPRAAAAAPVVGDSAGSGQHEPIDEKDAPEELDSHISDPDTVVGEDPEKPVEQEPVEQETAPEDALQVSEPVEFEPHEFESDAAEPDHVELTHETADTVEDFNTDEPSDAAPAPELEAEEEAPLFDELAEDHAADPETSVDVDEQLQQADDDYVTPHEEAQEAADIAAVTAEIAEQARQQTPAPTGEPAPRQEPLDDIEPAAGRIGRLRGRLSRSQNAIGQGLLGILTAGDLDEDAWEEIEDTLIMADLGADLTMRVTDALREKIAERGVSSEDEARAMLRETLIEAGRPEMDRSIKAMPVDGKPAVILVVGVNGTGKTTTTGKLGRVLVSMGHRVLFGAADTFRAAAADQLETWGRRVGATTVRGKEGADPASVAFDAVAKGVEEQADVVLVDTAGRLHTATGLMDQLGKVKRVVEKKSQVDEVLLVLDATVGQNGLTQARVFRDVVDITGVVLTKLDGTAKGGIVFQVQEELGVPVKLVGLGEGADDLAPFEIEGFVDALLG